MLIEVIFKGMYSTVDFSFLRELLVEAREAYFNYPEEGPIVTYSHVIEIINAETYIDLVIGTDLLHINEKKVPKVFINLGRDKEDIEIMFFFDLNDLNEATQKTSMDYLKMWIEEFKKKYDFQYFICQMDNAGEDEYYFDSNGIGKLWQP